MKKYFVSVFIFNWKTQIKKLFGTFLEKSEYLEYIIIIRVYTSFHEIYYEIVKITLSFIQNFTMHQKIIYIFFYKWEIFGMNDGKFSSKKKEYSVLY